LKISPETLLRGQIWPGTEALRLGLIDALGTETDAFKKAAELARVVHYQTTDLRNLVTSQGSYVQFFLQSPEGLRLPYPTEPGIYMLYIPQLPVEQ
jgi:ClpP class serine protease